MITLKDKNIERVHNLIEMCPDTFKYAPLKFYKDNDNNSFASVETVNINCDIIFSGVTTIDELPFEPGTGTVVKLPLNKTVLNNFFKQTSSIVNLSKEHIELEDKKKHLKISLFRINEEDILEFPYTGKEIFDIVQKDNSQENVNFTEVELDKNDVADFLHCVDVLSEPDIFTINVKNESIVIEASDSFGSSFKYTFNINTGQKFKVKFDSSLIKIFSKVSKYYSDYSIKILISELMIGFTLEKEGSTVALALTAQKV